MLKFLTPTIFLLLGITLAKEHVKNGIFYEIVNLATNASLTAEDTKSNSSVVLREKNGTDSQIWKAEQVDDLWAFHPKSNEALSLAVDNSGEGFFARLFVKGKHRRWMLTSLKNKGEDTVQLINFKYDTCLQSLGVGNQVNATACDDKDDFVWILHETNVTSEKNH